LSFPGFRSCRRSSVCTESAAVPTILRLPPSRDRLEALVLQWPHLALAAGTPLEDSRPGLWTVDTASGLPLFAFSTGEAHQVDTVVFLAPERHVGLSALRYWRRRRVRHFWFCELDGWRRKNAEATFVRQLYYRTVRERGSESVGGSQSALREWYGLLARSRRVQLLADSRAAAASWSYTLDIRGTGIEASTETVLAEDLFASAGQQTTLVEGVVQPAHGIAPWQRTKRGDVAA
jgi:hypothetical protein